MLNTHYKLNLNKPILAVPSYFAAFKDRVIKGDVNPDSNCIPTTSNVLGQIGVIDFIGFTVNDCSPIEAAVLGCISLQQFQQDLTALVSNDSVSHVVINFDSGGGYIMGIPETAQLIKELSAIKPIYAYTSGLMCSSAYFVASQCTNIIASPSSQVGSIGVYCEYEDDTAALERQGIVIKTFQGGSQKTIGSPYIALTDEQSADIQDNINKQWEDFKAVVVSNRGNVSQDVMQGQSFTGKQALEQNTNLIDGNINSLIEFLELLSAFGN
jgi:signal peptide peptidase SppA